MTPWHWLALVLILCGCAVVAFGIWSCEQAP